MSKTYFVGCRVDKQLFKKLNDHPLGNSDLIRKSVQQYFRGSEPNNRVDDYAEHPYNKNLVQLLQNQIDDLKQDKDYLMQQNNALLVARSPSLIEWFKYRLNNKYD